MATAHLHADPSSTGAASPAERAYLALLREILESGDDQTDRTGTGTRAVFGRQIRCDLADGFPLLTTKKVHFKSVAVELLWFIKGMTNVRWLQERGVSIWNEWADADGELGPVYGKQWRRWTGPDGREIDQLADLLDAIRNTPDSRRLILSAWNPADVPSMALPPCHTLFQFKVLGGRLHLQLYQRSADMFLGVPFNIASYALLLCMMAQATGYEPGEYIHTFGDAHIYANHMDQVREQLSRTPRPAPRLRLDPSVTDLFVFEYEHITLEGYDPHPAIKAPVAYETITMTSKAQFQQLSEMHAEDARILLEAHRHTNAVHLAGVAVECGLKALICDHFLDGVLPDRKLVDRAHSHQLDELIGLTGIKAQLQAKLDQDAEFEVRWSVVRAWSITTRYETISRPEATEFVSAVVDEEGILAWIKTFW